MESIVDGEVDGSIVDGEVEERDGREEKWLVGEIDRRCQLGPICMLVSFLPPVAHSS